MKLMKTGASGFMKGMGTGVMVGITASIAGAAVYSANRTSFKKTATKAVKAAGTLIDNVKYMVK